MAPDTASTPTQGDVLLLVGTMKGAFVVRSDAERREWRVDGPHFRGETVYSLAFDQRGRLYATEVSGKHHQILVLRRDGSLVRSFGADDGLKFPNGIAIGPGGNIYVTDGVFSAGRLLHIQDSLLHPGTLLTSARG